MYTHDRCHVRRKAPARREVLRDPDRIPAGVVTPHELETIARVAKKYTISLVKITSGQRFLLVGVQEKDIAGVRKELGPLGTASITPSVRYVQSCPGIWSCKNGTQDSITLAKTISDEYAGQDFPARSRSVSRAARGAAGRAGSVMSVSWEPLRAGP